MMSTHDFSHFIFDESKEYTFLKGFAMGSYMPDTLAALSFARNAHRNQNRHPSKPVPYSRYNGQAYISHPLTMACHALSIGIRDDATIATILLHDVLEDCDVTVDELPVSKETRNAVSLLTYTKPEQGDMSDEDYAQKVKRKKDLYYENLSKSEIASIVKIIDRCHNISTCADAFTLHKLQEYMDETETYVLPLIRETKTRFPAEQNALFVLKYHITSILSTIYGVLDMYQSTAQK